MELEEQLHYAVIANHRRVELNVHRLNVVSNRPAVQDFDILFKNPQKKLNFTEKKKEEKTNNFFRPKNSSKF